MPTKKIGWIALRSDRLPLAVIRDRCVYPAAALAEKGIESAFFSASRDAIDAIDSLDAIVFIRNLDKHASALAAIAKARGVRVFFDVWEDAFSGPLDYVRSSQNSTLLSSLDAIVTAMPTSPEKSDSRFDIPVVSIPDPIDARQPLGLTEDYAARFEPTARQRWSGIHTLWRSRLEPGVERIVRFMPVVLRSPSQALEIAKSKLAVSNDIRTNRSIFPAASPRHDQPHYAAGNRCSPAKKILWFTSLRSPQRDIFLLTLVGAAQSLQRLAKEIDFELIVVSDDFGVYRDFIAPLSFTSRCIALSGVGMSEMFRAVDVCLITGCQEHPSARNLRRSVTMALLNGVPVVANNISELDPLFPIVAFETWGSGLKRFLSPDGPARRDESLALARSALKALRSPEDTVELWSALIDGRAAIAKNRGGISASPMQRRIIALLLSLPQDLDLILPVIDELKRHPGHQLRVIIAPDLIAGSGRTLRALVDRDLVPWVPTSPSELDSDHPLCAADVLITASETSIDAHWYAHRLTKTARRIGVKTYTLQHGLENVGLNYFDSRHGRDITFASETILTWSDTSYLPKNTRTETRAKCITVGRTAIAPHPMALPEDLAGRRILGVFENLHWHRYSRQYRRSFVSDLVAFSKARPDIIVLVKPHPAGQYLASHMTGIGDHSKNLILANPSDKRWAQVTAPAIIPHCFAVVTTPSTTACDAAEADVPVAIAKYDLDLPVYDGLRTLENFDQWLLFAVAALTDPAAFQVGKENFRHRSNIGGNAAKRVANVLLGEEPPAGRPTKEL